MREAGVSDSDLRKLLEVVDPFGNFKDFSFDKQAQWQSALSGGKKNNNRKFMEKVRSNVLPWQGFSITNLCLQFLMNAQVQ